jgi:hypothetical protein
MQIKNTIRNIVIMVLITLTAAQAAATFTFQQALETFHKSKMVEPKRLIGKVPLLQGWITQPKSFYRLRLEKVCSKLAEPMEMLCLKL